MNKKIKKSARVVDRNKKKNTAVKPLTIKNQTMGKTKKKPEAEDITDSKKDATNKANSRMELKQVLEEIKGLPDDPVLINGFDNCIMGYDLETNSVIYDGYGVINQIVDEQMKDDMKAGELDGDWEDYYDRAYEYVCNDIVKSVSRQSFRKGKWVDLNAGRPLPLIMMLLK